MPESGFLGKLKGLVVTSDDQEGTPTPIKPIKGGGTEDVDALMARMAQLPGAAATDPNASGLPTAAPLHTGATNPAADQWAGLAGGASQPQAAVAPAKQLAAKPIVDPISGSIDFSPIYGQAGVPETPFTAENALETIEAMPAELPIDTKRKMVSVTMTNLGRTLGVSPTTIVADATAKINTLNTYAGSVQQQCTALGAQCDNQIASLEAQIDKLKSSKSQAEAYAATTASQCSAEVTRLSGVSTFFNTPLT